MDKDKTNSYKLKQVYKTRTIVQQKPKVVSNVKKYKRDNNKTWRVNEDGI